MNDLKPRLATCFTNIFPDLKPEEIPQASANTLATWDSVAQVTLLASIAEEFGIELEMADFDELVSYPLILEYLEQRVQ
ncbi:phosphopantetheine-binding protein [Bryobacter aggregatus]|uniref:phosphopantetheine-binding protein n=1 Tax=Bryobacter aggregatus TaxID=360054 RepID=UPI0004E21F62|nr:phosphopantetheine-binding protein [Bryobacter aggregatus]